MLHLSQLKFTKVTRYAINEFFDISRLSLLIYIYISYIQEIYPGEDNPGGVEWWRSGVIVFNTGNVQAVSLEVVHVFSYISQVRK